jgi:RimJ/RimL family protein N-acetyltransferase
MAIVEGVLEGKIQGDIWLNENKDGCFIATETIFNFVAGNFNKEFLKNCLSMININHDTLIIHCNDQNYFQKHNYPIKLRSHFSGQPKDIKELLEKISNKILKKYVLLRIKEEIFDKCYWGKRVLHFYGDKTNFFKYGYGAALLSQGEVIAEVYGTIGGSCLELGAFTSPIHRGNGLVPFIISTLVKQYCLENRLMISASCNVDNVPSKKTILRLGLCEDFQYYCFEASKYNWDQ